MLLLLFILFNVVTTLYSHQSHQTNKTGDDLTSRILYGKRADIKDYPFFATLIDGRNNSPYCGAAIVSDRWLLTAAHCVSAASIRLTGKRVWVGGDTIHTSQQFTFDKVVIYPEYHYNPNSSIVEAPINDIALMRLSRPLAFSPTVKPVKLPKKDFTRNALHAFVGHGKDETGHVSQHLMTMNVHTLNPYECLINFPWMKRIWINWYIGHVSICTKRIEDMAGACHGDSGSPLVQGDTVVGLASFITGTNCAENRLTMFTNVAPFVLWIKSVTGIKN